MTIGEPEKLLPLLTQAEVEFLKTEMGEVNESLLLEHIGLLREVYRIDQRDIALWKDSRGRDVSDTRNWVEYEAACRIRLRPCMGWTIWVDSAGHRMRPWARYSQSSCRWFAPEKIIAIDIRQVPCSAHLTHVKDVEDVAKEEKRKSKAKDAPFVAYSTMSKYHQDFLSPSKPLSKSQRSRARREPSGVFSLFQPNQIHLFREAFSLIDHDGDGVVNEQDLKHIFTSLGITASKQRLNDLLSDRPGTHSRAPSSDDNFGSDRGITFPMFLTMMGEHLYDFDTEQELLSAFECFDENDTGFVKCDEMRKWLSETGERMDETDIDRFLKGPFTDRQGNFNYREWVKVLRINADNDETEP